MREKDKEASSLNKPLGRRKRNQYVRFCYVYLFKKEAAAKSSFCKLFSLFPFIEKMIVFLFFMIEYKNENSSIIIGPSVIEHQDIELPRAIQPEERDSNLLEELAEMFLALSDAENPDEILSAILAKLEDINYNIDDVIEDTEALNKIASILMIEPEESSCKLCLKIINKLLSLSHSPIVFLFENINCLIPLIKNTSLNDDVFKIIYAIIYNNNKYAEGIVLHSRFLKTCSEVIEESEETRGDALMIVYYVLNLISSSCFHSYVEDEEIIMIPLKTIKWTISNNFHLVVSFNIFTLILDNWTTSFWELFDQELENKIIEIWLRAFPEKWELPLCAPMIRILNKIIFLFHDDFLYYKLYNQLLATVKAVAEREDFPHLKILFLLSNVAADKVSGSALIESGVFELYESRYSEMTHFMKENFLFMFGNLILSGVIAIDGDERTNDYIIDMASLGSSSASLMFVKLFLRVIEENQEEIKDNIDCDVISEFFDSVKEKEDEELQRKVDYLVSVMFSQSDSDGD